LGLSTEKMRQDLLKKVHRIVIKIGSGVISDENGLVPARLERLAEDICKLIEQGIEVVMVSSGAVAAGRRDLGIKGRPTSIPLQQAAASIGQSRLMRLYRSTFRSREQNVGQILLTRDDLANRRRYLNARNTLMTLLEFGVTPIINENDTVVVDELRFGDNDNLSAMVSSLSDSDLLVILSDVDGYYNADPHIDPEARRIAYISEITPEIEAAAGSSGSTIGTGGMHSKIQAAKKVTLAGIACVIVDGGQLGILDRLFKGESVGTWFSPASQPMSARKCWIAFSMQAAGKITIDTGAVKAVQANGKSLLPSGIISLSGRFDRGDAVLVCDPEGQDFARGISNYSHHELIRIIGKRTTEIESILGYRYGDEIIHRDNLVLNS